VLTATNQRPLFIIWGLNFGNVFVIAATL
jgi:hypothetical protein